jgi:CubicO group peptidase (beta-lactamase class C family)
VVAADLDDVGAELQRLAEHAAVAHHAPALTWGVVLGGRLALSGACGRLTDGGAPTSRTVFRIASMTKTFTAAAVLTLRDQGLLALDDALPEISAPTADVPAITWRHALSMQSGLTADDPWADRHLDISAAELDTLLAAGPRFALAPGTAFEYSNLGYAAVGRAVERLCGEPVQRVVDRLVLGPLGLARTTWTEPEHDDWAWPHRVVDGAAVADARPLGDGALAPMGGLWSNVEDLGRVVVHFDDAFPARDEPDPGPLRRASRREQQQLQRFREVIRTEAHGEGLEHVPERLEATGYGFGLHVGHDRRLGHIAGHSGGLPGYGSNMRWLPGRRAGAIALANSTYAPMRHLTLRMLEVLDGHGLVAPVAMAVSPALQRAAETLVALVNGWADDAADAVFADNVALDEPYERRAQAAAAVIGEHGPLTLQRVEAELATDATAVASAADGTEVRLWFALSPLPTARIQDYEITC